MRAVHVSFNVPTSTLIQKTATQEIINHIDEYKDLRRIQVEVQLKSDAREILDKQNFVISGDPYDLLMSASPDFAPGKPENEYREVDLFYIIDQIRAKQNQ